MRAVTSSNVIVVLRAQCGVFRQKVGFRASYHANHGARKINKVKKCFSYTVAKANLGKK